MKTSYEYLVRVEFLKEPVKAEDVMKHLNSKGINPVAVTADNMLGKITVYFSQPLGGEEKEKLDKEMEKYLKSIKK